MIEAVNSVLSNAPVARAAAEQQSVATSFAANPDRVQVVAQAPYISPYVHVDVNFNKAVLQIRDSDTGDVVRTIPTEGQMEAYRRAQNALTPAVNVQETKDNGEVPPQQQTTTTSTRLDVAQQSAPVVNVQQAAPVQSAPAQVSVNTQV